MILMDKTDIKLIITVKIVRRVRENNGRLGHVERAYNCRKRDCIEIILKKPQQPTHLTSNFITQGKSTKRGSDFNISAQYNQAFSKAVLRLVLYGYVPLPRPQNFELLFNMKLSSCYLETPV